MTRSQEGRLEIGGQWVVRSGEFRLKGFRGFRAEGAPNNRFTQGYLEKCFNLGFCSIIPN